MRDEIGMRAEIAWGIEWIWLREHSISRVQEVEQSMSSLFNLHKGGGRERGRKGRRNRELSGNSESYCHKVMILCQDYGPDRKDVRYLEGRTLQHHIKSMRPRSPWHLPLLHWCLSSFHPWPHRVKLSVISTVTEEEKLQTFFRDLLAVYFSAG